MYATKPCGSERDLVGQLVEQQQKPDALAVALRDERTCDWPSTISQSRSNARSRTSVSLARRSDADAGHRAAPSEIPDEGAIGGRALRRREDAHLDVTRGANRDRLIGSPARALRTLVAGSYDDRQIEQRVRRHAEIDSRARDDRRRRR